jgi:2-(1,2-epoxy-1,2-dihydrophenyl)acetyl-CoA isomerase
MMRAFRVRREEQHDGAVLRLTLAAPPHNALDGEMTRELCRLLDGEDARPPRKLIVLAADGPSFSVDGDGTDGAAARAGLHELFRRLMALGAPTAALVHGECRGAGLALATFANFVLASSDARFGLATRAAWPLTAQLIVPLKLGLGAARELALGDGELTAEEAYRRGLVVAFARPGESLDALADAWLSAHVLTCSAASLARANRAARLGFHTRLRHDLALLERLGTAGVPAPLYVRGGARTAAFAR